MKEFIKKHISFLNRSPEYLLVDAGNPRVTRVRLLQGEKHFEVISDEPRALSAKEAIRHDTKLILSLGHRQATTLRAVVPVVRTEPKAPITEAELENVVSRGLWKLFNQKRRESAAKMKAEDIAVKACDADIIAVRLDGHHVLDPLEFSAREIELECQETLVVQPTLSALLEILPEEQVVSVQESPAAWPLLACSVDGKEDFLAVSVLPSETVLYRYGAGELRCIDTFAWGSSDILKAVAGFFGMSLGEAEGFLDLYRNGKASENVLKKVETVLSQELSILFKGIEAHNLQKQTKRIYIASGFRIPENLLSTRYLRKIGIGFAPVLLDTRWISEKLGYTLKSSESGEVAAPDSTLAALAVYHAQKETPLGKIAKRRVRWMQSN